MQKLENHIYFSVSVFPIHNFLASSSVYYDCLGVLGEAVLWEEGSKSGGWLSCVLGVYQRRGIRVILEGQSSLG